MKEHLDPPRSQPPGESGSLDAERVELRRILSRGPGALVFLAVSEIEGERRPCVVKRIKRESISEADVVSSFLNDAEIAAALRHDNLARVFDFGYVDGACVLVMEPVIGVDLLSLLGVARRSSRILPEEVVLSVATQVCDGLRHLHEGAGLGRGELVHGNLSLSNLMVDREGTVKLLDFGMTTAWPTHPYGVADGGRCGYMSPEQIAGTSTDGRSDLFSLGVVVHELLSGRRLFHRAEARLTLQAVLEDAARCPSWRRPELSEATCALVERALEKGRERRFASALEFREAVSACSPEGREPGRAALAEWVARTADAALREMGEDVGAALAMIRADRAQPESSLEPEEPAPRPADEPAATGRRGPGLLARVVRTALVVALLTALGLAGWFVWLEREKPPWWSYDAWRESQGPTIPGTGPIPLPEQSPPRVGEERRPEQSAAVATEEGPSAVSDGEILIVCERPCRAFLNGVRVRMTTPPEPMRLKAGFHDLRVVDRRTRREEQREVLVAPGRVRVERVEFAPTFLERDGTEEWR